MKTGLPPRATAPFICRPGVRRHHPETSLEEEGGLPPARLSALASHHSRTGKGEATLPLVMLNPLCRYDKRDVGLSRSA